MTPLGFHIAAVPEAAALFPLSAAVPPASENAGAAATAFGDLLAASFAQAGLPEDAVPADLAGSAFNTLSLADVWFAGLNVDLHALNASLEVEEAGLPAEAVITAGVPADVADETDAVGDEDAALMAFAMSIPVPVPAPLSIAEPVDEPNLHVGRATAPHRAGATGTPPEGPPGAPEGLAPQADLIRAASVNSNAAIAHVNAASVVEAAAGDVPATGYAPVDATSAIGRVLSGLPGAPEGLAPQARPASVAPVVNVASTSVIDAPQASIALSGLPGDPERLAGQKTASTSDVGRATAPHRASATGTPLEGPPAAQETASTSDVGRALSGAPGEPEGLAAHANTARSQPADASSVEEQPKAQLPKAIDGAPSIQQTGRTRESVAAKLAEMSGLGLGGEAVAKPAPGTNLGTDSQSQSQSQTQDGSTQDASALGVRDNAAAPRSADGAAVTPVFAVAAPVNGPARAVLVEGATLPPAPPAATVPDPENVGRLIESMRVQMRQGVQEATVRLKPEHMGEVTISIRVERGAVSAVVNAETPAVQQWLESQEDKLRSGLSDQGLHLEKFIVQRDGSQARREQPQQQPHPAPRDRRQRDGTPIRFEVLV